MAALKDHTLYSSAKGALDMLTKTMALELGPHGNTMHTPSCLSSARPQSRSRVTRARAPLACLLRVSVKYE